MDPMLPSQPREAPARAFRSTAVALMVGLALAGMTAPAQPTAANGGGIGGIAIGLSNANAPPWVDATNSWEVSHSPGPSWIRLSWGQASIQEDPVGLTTVELSHYKVYRSLQTPPDYARGPYELFAQVEATDAESYQLYSFGPTQEIQYFQVTAVTTDGQESPRTEETGSTIPGVPNPPSIRSLKTGCPSCGFELKWGRVFSYPAHSGWYEVYGITGTSQYHLGSVHDSSCTSGIYTCVLTRSSGYPTYRVSVHNDYGTSSSYVSSAYPPSAPASLAAETGQDRGIALSWYAPGDSGATSLQGYKVFRASAGGPKTHLATTGATSYRDLAVDPGVTYSYTVTAFNSVAEGPQSNEASAVAPTVPGAPRNLVAVPGSEATTLYWQAPESNGGAWVTSYNIYRGSESGSETYLANTGPNPLVGFPGYSDTTCQPPMACYYKVTAVNPVGEGPQSNEASTVGLPGPP